MKLTFDGTLDIATGRSRKETSWKNRQWLWSDLVKKLSVTHRTAETFSDYLAAKRSRQDEIKDIGGFVGGYLNSGRKKKGSVAHRQLLTLDADYAKVELWEDFTMLYDCAACLYSTHKHSPESPRYRLIIPVDRELLADEFIAISRKIAGNLGIDQFDHSTSYQLERLMYWPSSAADAVYEFQVQDGPWLKADEILSSYHSWKDSSEWPVSSREDKIVTRDMKKQGDPLEKPGVVGAFCRTYDIHQAIEKFLSSEYEPCDIEGRYTYKNGSTSAGLVTYDDKFAFSHHATDPAGGKLCNAFDLIRLHKYGLLDEDANPNAPGNKLPSYLKMCDLAVSDTKVKVQITNEKAAEAKDEFAIEIIEPENDEWKEKLDRDRKGNLYPTINNLVLMLENDPAFKGNIVYDEFEQQPIFKRSLPWRKVTAQTRYMTDRDDDNIEHYLEKKYDIATTKLEKALSVVFDRHVFHPVRDYLNNLFWDGQYRVDTLLIDYMGAEDSDYTKAVTRKTLCAAVARVMKPGIKFDYVLTLIGDEGKGKSTLFNLLGRQWFSDTFNLHMLSFEKKAYEQLRGAWIIEIAELAGMAKAEVERVKAFISAREDRYRWVWGHHIGIYPRQNIFLASTNKGDFLRSQTGNRRFWPVQIDIPAATLDVFTDMTDEEVNQVWAEAVELYKKGENLYLPVDLENQAILRQKRYTEEHPWTGVIETYLDKKLPAEWHKFNNYERLSFLSGEDELAPAGTVTRDRVCILEIWNEALRKRETIDEYSAGIIRSIMRNIKWVEKFEPARFGPYGLQRRGFFRVTNGVLKADTNSNICNTENDLM